MVPIQLSGPLLGRPKSNLGLLFHPHLQITRTPEATASQKASGD